MTGEMKKSCRKNGKGPLGGELQVALVPLPPEKRLAWRAGMADIYAVFEEALARERAAASTEEAG